MPQSPVQTLETLEEEEEEQQPHEETREVTAAETLEASAAASSDEDSQRREVEAIRQPETEEEGEEEEEEDEEEEFKLNEDNMGPVDVMPEIHPPDIPRRRKKRSLTTSARQKLRLLTENFSPIPFSPVTTLDIDAHEDLFRALGLREFATLDLSGEIRSDLLIHLIANHDLSKDRSFVDDVDISVGLLDLAEALRLPLKEKDVGVEAEQDIFSKDNSKEVIGKFLSEYILLEADDEDEMLILPQEVVDANALVKEGRPYEIDWAGLMWAWVKKDIVDASITGSCRYASHLQCLMKFQQPKLFEREVEAVPDLEPESSMEVSVSTDDEDDVSVSTDDGEEEDDTIGLDEFQNMTDLCSDVQANVGLMDGLEGCKESEDGGWIDDAKGEGIEHCLRRCNSIEVRGMEFGNSCVGEQVEREDGFSNLERITSTELLHDVHADHVSYMPRMNSLNQNSVDFVSMGICGVNNASVDPGQGGSFYFENNGKRHIENVGVDEDDSGCFHQGNQQKRMRCGGLWEEQAPSSGFASYLAHIQCAMGKAEMLYDEKEQACLDAHIQLQCMNDMLKQKEHHIQTLEKAQVDDHLDWQQAVHRYEHEINTLANIVVGLKKALKNIRSKFEEYRKKCPQGDVPFYADVGGSGGLVISSKQLEMLRLEKEEEKRRTAEEMIDAFQYQWLKHFEDFHEMVIELYSRQAALVEEVKLMKEKFAERKNSGWKAGPNEKDLIVTG